MRILSGKVRRKKMRVHLPMSPRAVIAEVVAALEQAELEAGTIAPCPFYPNGRRRRTKAPCPSLAHRHGQFTSRKTVLLRFARAL
jgi:hypothetical protein